MGSDTVQLALFSFLFCCLERDDDSECKTSVLTVCGAVRMSVGVVGFSEHKKQVTRKARGGEVESERDGQNCPSRTHMEHDSHTHGVHICIVASNKLFASARRLASENTLDLGGSDRVSANENMPQSDL